MSYIYIYKLKREKHPNYKNPTGNDKYLVYLDGETKNILKIDLVNAPIDKVRVVSLNTFEVKANYDGPVELKIYQNADKPVIKSAYSQTKKDLIGNEYAFIYQVQSVSKESSGNDSIIHPDPGEEEKKETKARVMRTIIFLVIGLVFVLVSVYLIGFVKRKAFSENKT